MKSFKLDEMTAGWFVGDFEPSVIRTSEFEVAVKQYSRGDREGKHVHKVAQEVTLILSGSVRMNSRVFSAGDIVLLEPGEPTNFEAITEGVVTVVVKTPSVIGDKYVEEES